MDIAECMMKEVQNFPDVVNQNNVGGDFSFSLFTVQMMSFVIRNNVICNSNVPKTLNISCSILYTKH